MTEIYLEGDFHVLAAPHIESRVISSKLVEVGFVNREKPACHDWTSTGLKQGVLHTHHITR